MVPLADQICVADLEKVRIDCLRVSAVQPIIQNLRNIVPMCDPENEAIGRIQFRQHRVDSRHCRRLNA
jgi:hypothetical protein